MSGIRECVSWSCAAVLVSVLAAGCSGDRARQEFSSHIRLEEGPCLTDVNWEAVPEGEYDARMFSVYTVQLGDRGVRLVGYRPDVLWAFTDLAGDNPDSDLRIDMACLMWHLHGYVVLVRDKSGLYIAQYISDRGAWEEQGPVPGDVEMEFNHRDPETAFWQVDDGKTYIERGFYDEVKEMGVIFPPDCVPGPRDCDSVPLRPARSAIPIVGRGAPRPTPQRLSVSSSLAGTKNASRRRTSRKPHSSYSRRAGALPVSTARPICGRPRAAVSRIAFARMPAPRPGAGPRARRPGTPVRPPRGDY